MKLCALLDRSSQLARLEGFRRVPCDVLVIGGGATGVSCALDAVLRGYETVLLEACDFAKGTSSRSTKIIHGGVRYLRQGQVGLVYQSLRERWIWLQRAPGLVKPMAFAIPCAHRWGQLYYGAGLKAYDWLGKQSELKSSRLLSRGEMGGRFAGLPGDPLGVLYEDAQFDDARLAVEMAKSAAREGATVLNHVRVQAFRQSAGRIKGVSAEDMLTGKSYEVTARVVINATGVFSSKVRALPGSGERGGGSLTPSQGIHFVLPSRFLSGETALMIPRTDDGRVLFAIPWHGQVLFGTTDTPRDAVSLEPRPLAEEVDYLLEHGRKCFAEPPRREDVLSVFAGLRPLVTPSGGKRKTSKISRDHQVDVSATGLVTVSGGKWTTARHMAEDAVDVAAESGGLPGTACSTQVYGLEDGLAGENLVDPGPGVVEKAVKEEMAMTVEDVLARRARALFLDTRHSVKAAPRVAAQMADLLGRDEGWIREQTEAFTRLAEGYLIEGCGKAPGESIDGK